MIGVLLDYQGVSTGFKLDPHRLEMGYCMVGIRHVDASRILKTSVC